MNEGAEKILVKREVNLPVLVGNFKQELRTDLKGKPTHELYITLLHLQELGIPECEPAMRAIMAELDERNKDGKDLGLVGHCFTCKGKGDYSKHMYFIKVLEISAMRGGLPTKILCHRITVKSDLGSNEPTVLLFPKLIEKEEIDVSTTNVDGVWQICSNWTISKEIHEEVFNYLWRVVKEQYELLKQIDKL